MVSLSQYKANSSHFLIYKCCLFAPVYKCLFMHSCHNHFLVKLFLTAINNIFIRYLSLFKPKRKKKIFMSKCIHTFGDISKGSIYSSPVALNNGAVPGKIMVTIARPCRVPLSRVKQFDKCSSIMILAVGLLYRDSIVCVYNVGGMMGELVRP